MRLKLAPHADGVVAPRRQLELVDVDVASEHFVELVAPHEAVARRLREGLEEPAEEAPVLDPGNTSK